jgi:hypothetical protein
LYLLKIRHGQQITILAQACDYHKKATKEKTVHTNELKHINGTGWRVADGTPLVMDGLGGAYEKQIRHTNIPIKHTMVQLVIMH